MGMDIPQDALGNVDATPQAAEEPFGALPADQPASEPAQEPIQPGSELSGDTGLVADQPFNPSDYPDPEAAKAAWRQMQSNLTRKFQDVAEQRRSLDEQRKQVTLDADAVRTVQQQLSQTMAQLSYAQQQPQQTARDSQSERFRQEAQRALDAGDEMGARQFNVAAQQALETEGELAQVRGQIGQLTQYLQQQQAQTQLTGLIVQERTFLDEQPLMKAYKTQVAQARRTQPGFASLPMNLQYLALAGNDLLAKAATAEQRVAQNAAKKGAAAILPPGRGAGPSQQPTTMPDATASLEDIFRASAELVQQGGGG